MWTEVYHVPEAFQYIYVDAVMEVKMGMGMRGVRFQEGKEWRLLTSCMQKAWFCAEVRGRIGLKVNASKSNMMM